MIPNQDRCDLDSHHSLTHLQISIPRALDAVVEASPDTEQPPEEVRSGARACVSERERATAAAKERKIPQEQEQRFDTTAAPQQPISYQHTKLRIASSTVTFPLCFSVAQLLLARVAFTHWIS